MTNVQSIFRQLIIDTQLYLSSYFTSIFVSKNLHSYGFFLISTFVNARSGFAVGQFPEQE